MSQEINWAAIHRIETAVSKLSMAAQLAGDAANRIAYQLEPGYGGNGLRLIELLETVQVPSSAEPELLKVCVQGLDKDGWHVPSCSPNVAWLGEGEVKYCPYCGGLFEEREET